MLPDRVSNPGPMTYESGALPIALRGPADKPWYNYYLPLGVYHMFSNLSTFRENANNEESDQTGLLGGGRGGGF